MTPNRRASLALATLLTLVAGLSPALAVEHSTPAVNGYDVVSYFEGGKPLPGNGNHVAIHEGVTYLFVDEENRSTFEANPERYVPAYGGYCAYGVSVGKKFAADPNVWEIVHGRLYLNLDHKVQGLWAEDIAGHIAKADEQWPEIRGKSPSAL